MGAPVDEAADRPSTGGPPAWIILLVTGVAAALVVGGIVGYRAWRGDGDEPAAAPPDIAAPATTAEPAEVPERRLFTRETDTGIEVRVDLGVPAGVVGDLGVAAGAPAFCQVVDQATATAISNDEVLQGWLPLTEDAPPDPAPTMLGSMMGFGAGSMLGLVVQVEGAVNARLSAPGRVDEMEPVQGIAALVVTMPPQQDQPDADDVVGQRFPGPIGMPQLDDVTLSVSYADGRVRHVRGDDLAMGPLIWRGDAECFGGPPELGPPKTFSEQDNPFNVRLPPAGEQPADPAAARAAIEAAMTTLYGAGDDVDVLTLVDDPFAIRETFVRIGDIDVGADWSDVEILVEELVFLSPVEAAFEYTVSVEEYFDRDEQFGRARLVDGTWRVGRGTICRDLQESFATTCPP